MSRTLSTTIALCCLTAGCFGAHGVDDPPIDDPPIDDPPQWTDCYEALYSAAPGETCDFTGECGGVGSCEPEPTRTAMCIEGRVRFVQRICEPPAWSNCEEYIAGRGSVGERCDGAIFGTCSTPPIDCCETFYSCDAGVVRAEPYCEDDCSNVLLCADYIPPASGTPLCASNADCAEGAYCVPPGTPTTCGICFEPIDECASDADCADIDVCVSETQLCSCGGPSNRCLPRCSPGGCADGFICSTAGTCDPISCADGFVCGDNLRCVIGGGASDEHDCARLRCGTAADCDCGACIEGYCYTGFGACEFPRP